MPLLDHAHYPLEPAQALEPTTYRVNQPTGMVYCPIRRSHIGIMRCDEYQKRDHCARGCANAAPKEMIALLEAALKTVPRESGPRTFTCAACGGPKAQFYGTNCRSCSKAATAKARPKYFCARCGAEKKSAVGRLCRSCGSLGNKGGKVRAAQIRAAKACTRCQKRRRRTGLLCGQCVAELRADRKKRA